MPKKSHNAAPSLPKPGAPMPLQVQEDEDMRPVAVVLDGKSLAVESIDDRSEAEEAWWQDDPVVRMNYQAIAVVANFSALHRLTHALRRG